MVPRIQGITFSLVKEDLRNLVSVLLFVLQREESGFRVIASLLSLSHHATLLEERVFLNICKLLWTDLVLNLLLRKFFLLCLLGAAKEEIIRGHVGELL